MTHLPNHAGVTYSKLAQRLLNPNAVVRSDADPAYKSIGPHVQAHLPKKSAPKNASQALPWVHIAISNVKRLFLGLTIICLRFGCNRTWMSNISSSMAGGVETSLFFNSLGLPPQVVYIHADKHYPKLMRRNRN